LISVIVGLAMLPVEIGQLANLTTFDLKDCPNVKYPKPLMRDNSKRVLAFFSKLFQMKQNQFGVSDIVDANDPPTWMAFIAFCTKAEFAGSLYKAVKHCPSLANLKDDDSGSTIRVLFEVAHKESREAMQKVLLFLCWFDVNTGDPLHVSAMAVVLKADDYASKNKDGLPI
jgi:hypothetical protein